MGRSLHSREGVALWSAQSTQGTAVAPATGLGVAEVNATDNGDFRQIYTVGKTNLHKNKGGIARTDWSANIQNVEDKAFLQKLIRSSGVLPWVTLGFGSNDGTNKETWQIQDCKLGQAEIALDGGGFLSANVSGIGGLITVLSGVGGLVAAHLTGMPFISYEGVMLYNASAYEVKGFRTTINHNLEVEAVIAGAARTSGKKRMWDYLTEGREIITGSVTLGAASATSFQADNPAAGSNMSLALTDVASGAHTITIALTQVEFTGQTRQVPLDGYIGYELPFVAYGFNIT